MNGKVDIAHLHCEVDIAHLHGEVDIAHLHGEVDIAHLPSARGWFGDLRPNHLRTPRAGTLVL